MFTQLTRPKESHEDDIILRLFTPALALDSFRSWELSDNSH